MRVVYTMSAYDGIDEAPVPKVVIKKPEKEIKVSVDNFDEEKARLIYQIQCYSRSKRFGAYLKDQGHCFDEGKLRKLSVDELKFEVQKNEKALDARGNCDFFDHGLRAALEQVEEVIHVKTPYKCRGTVEKSWQDDNVLDIIERIKLKHSMPFMKLEPELALAISLARTSLICHRINTARTTVDLDAPVGGIADASSPQAPLE